MSRTSALEGFLKRMFPAGDREISWARLLWLAYIAYLFVPLAWPGDHRTLLWATLASLPLFLPLYFRQFRHARVELFIPLGMALLCYALAPVNWFSNTYLIYAAVAAPVAVPGILRPLLLVFAMIAVYAVELFLIGWSRGPFINLTVTVMAAPVVCLTSYMSIEHRRKRRELMQSHEEIRRLAALAERERIGRDLHDLLGHTLSLVAIKSELAEKLAPRDADAAAREMKDVKEIAREALKEVRTAVSGIRAAALEGELASARVLLGSSGVELKSSRIAAGLPADVSSSVAMIIREAVTNIHRHAGASHAEIEIRNEDDAVVLTVSDDGKGGITTHGNGLTGIGERVRNHAGTLDITSSPGEGTVVSARLPLLAHS